MGQALKIFVYSAKSNPSYTMADLDIYEFFKSQGTDKEKHKIFFETAAYVFVDPYYIEMYDFEHSVGEDRYIVGKVGDVLFFVFTERKETIRLLSARLATNAERELYYDQNINY